MLWARVERRAQLTAWFISLVTKPGAAFYENACISRFIFSTNLPSPTCLSRHIGFSVEGSGQKVTFSPPPTWHPYRFQKSEPRFYSSQSAVCLESLVEIRPAGLEKSLVKDERQAQVRGWVQTRQRFSGMACPIFVRFSPYGTEFIQPESITALRF